VVFDFSACSGVGEEISKHNIKVYPNPSGGIFMLEFEEISGDAVIEIYSVNGAMLQETGLIARGPGRVTEVIDLSGFPKGVYFLKFMHERFVVYEKLLIH